MKSLPAYIILLFLFGCEKPKDAGNPKTVDDALVQKRIEENRPRLLSIQFDFDTRRQTYGFVMEGGYSENHQRTTMYITGDEERRELNKEDEKRVYDHLLKFYELPKTEEYLKTKDSEVVDKTAVYNLLTFDSDEFKHKIYNLPRGDSDFEDWVVKFHDLYEELH